ncbi:unnamed protein product, partial [Mesorhabditis belari]|uniref:Uncharacterized protein n=1 Tax=Mesorhabditis belari TaxID=2138241 RepID=A0AAF3ER85_9BILA
MKKWWSNDEKSWSLLDSSMRDIHAEDILPVQLRNLVRPVNSALVSVNHVGQLELLDRRPIKVSLQSIFEPPTSSHKKSVTREKTDEKKGNRREERAERERVPRRRKGRARKARVHERKREGRRRVSESPSRKRGRDHSRETTRRVGPLRERPHQRESREVHTESAPQASVAVPTRGSGQRRKRERGRKRREWRARQLIPFVHSPFVKSSSERGSQRDRREHHKPPYNKQPETAQFKMSSTIRSRYTRAINKFKELNAAITGEDENTKKLLESYLSTHVKQGVEFLQEKVSEIESYLRKFNECEDRWFALMATLNAEEKAAEDDVMKKYMETEDGPEYARDHAHMLIT